MAACLVARAHAAVHTHSAVVGEGDCAGRDVPALQRACARQEPALWALRIQPRLKRMALRPSHTADALLYLAPLTHMVSTHLLTVYNILNTLKVCGST